MELITIAILLIWGALALCLYLMGRLREWHPVYVEAFRAYAAVGLVLGSVYLLTYLYH